MSDRYKNLTEPLVLRNKVLKSRFIYPVAQPHFLQANELYPSDPIVAYYTNRCKNGVALILLHDLTELTQRYGFADTGHFAGNPDLSKVSASAKGVFADDSDLLRDHDLFKLCAA